MEELLGGVCIYLIQAIVQARSTKVLNERIVFLRRRAMRRKHMDFN